ncbi:MAG: response regulator [Salinivirgaceae bacterium]|nr:response regulator [Salinivirgaceae bacterium]
MKISNDIRIHIVEDDPVQAQVLQDKLLEFNSEYNLRCFKSGEELFSYFKNGYEKNKYNYIILDYFLQTSENTEALNGMEIIAQLENNLPKVKIILYSAYENDDDTKFDEIKKKSNVIDFVKKSIHSYSRLQNIIRFDFSHESLIRKRRRFQFAMLGFVVTLALATLYFFSTSFFY